MELILRCASLCVMGSIIALLLKKNVPELSVLLGLSVGLSAAVFCSKIMGEISLTLRDLARNSALDAVVIAPVLKCVGIGVVTEVAKELCKDAGEGTLASFTELCGSLCAMYATLPLLRSLLAVIEELV